MGMGFAAGGVFNGMAQQMFAPMNGGVQQQQQSPVQAAPSGRFSQQSDVRGANTNTGEDPAESLGKLKKLLDAGLIEQSEFDAKKAEILARL
jgi:membrane protease subunit (stomatin/prohibitin family)